MNNDLHINLFLFLHVCKTCLATKKRHHTTVQPHLMAAMAPVNPKAARVLCSPLVELLLSTKLSYVPSIARETSLPPNMLEVLRGSARIETFHPSVPEGVWSHRG